MILTGPEILAQLAQGALNIEPFDPSCIQPNGYDFHLHPQLRAFSHELDAATAPQGQELYIDPVHGLELQPHTLYLGLTLETFQTSEHALWIFGDRSVGSLGIWVQVSAPLGHVGSKIRWTLEIVVVKPVRVYAGMRFGKVCFLGCEGQVIPYGDPWFSQPAKYLEDELRSSQLSIEPLADGDPERS